MIGSGIGAGRSKAGAGCARGGRGVSRAAAYDLKIVRPWRRHGGRSGALRPQQSARCVSRPREAPCGPEARAHAVARCAALAQLVSAPRCSGAAHPLGRSLRSQARKGRQPSGATRVRRAQGFQAPAVAGQHAQPQARELPEPRPAPSRPPWPPISDLASVCTPSSSAAAHSANTARAASATRSAGGAPHLRDIRDAASRARCVRTAGCPLNRGA